MFTLHSKCASKICPRRHLYLQDSCLQVRKHFMHHPRLRFINQLFILFLWYPGVSSLSFVSDTTFQISWVVKLLPICTRIYHLCILYSKDFAFASIKADFSIAKYHGIYRLENVYTSFQNSSAVFSLLKSQIIYFLAAAWK